MKPIVKVDDEIITLDNLKGTVLKIYVNSVLIKITENPNDLNFELNRTIVPHSKYNIVNKL